MSTIFEIKQKLSFQADSVAQMLLPQGYKRGNHWIVGNVRGEAGQSLSVCLSGDKAGLWYDFAEGSGGDLLDLWCGVKGITLSQALEEARSYLNLKRPKPFMAPQRFYHRPSLPSGDTPQNLVKTYLNKERHIPLAILERYHIKENGKKIIFPFYKPDGTLALVKERLAQAGAKAKPTTSQCEAILFGWQALFPRDPACASTNQCALQTDSELTLAQKEDCSTDQKFTSVQQKPVSANQHLSPASQELTPAQKETFLANQECLATSQKLISEQQRSWGAFLANQKFVLEKPNFGSTNRTIVITEGEIDALSLAAYGYPAVSVPFGGGTGGKQNWIENEFDHLESFETIFLATDMDKSGEEAAHEIANRLGRHRCYRVRLPKKDANECLTTGINIETIQAAFSSAKSFAPEGLRRASDYKNKIIGLFWPTPEQRQGYTVPYPKLKDKLYFRPAELTLWSGSSGVGKSQLLSDCIPHWIAQKSRLCLASLEMKGEQSLRRLIKQTGGLKHPTKEMIEQILHFLDEGLILYEHVGKSSVDTLLDVFDYCRARYGCDQFIIDSLMRLGIASDDYTGQEQAVYKMVNWAVSNAVHIHLVSHTRKSGLEREVPTTEDIKGASEIGANAFNIITIWRNRSLEDKICATSNREEKAALAKRPGVIMNIAKQRSGDFEGKVGLWFDLQTYRYRCSCEYSSSTRHYLGQAEKPAKESLQ
ncbi:toprim domain-containing protein [Bartonella sp. B30(2025)]